MYKIAVIGDKDSVMGFMAIGFSVFVAEDAIVADGIMRDIAARDYAVIFITEKLAADMPDSIARYKDVPLPAVIMIPGRSGSDGIGIDSIKKSVERAVGADILFRS